MRSRRIAALLLVVGVSAMHLWLAGTVLESRLGNGAADTRPKPIEVAFVRELQPVVPVRAAAPAKRLRPRVPKRVAAAASQPAALAPAEVAAATPEPEAPAVESTPPAASPAGADSTSAPAGADIASAPAVAEAASAAEEVPQAPAPAASAPLPFEWPPSTRLSYVLTGNYRGPVEGQAQVEWLRSGERYQVRFEVSIGPAFKPLVRQRFTSDGEITEQGLAPRRYDEERQVIFSEARLLTVLLDDTLVHLSNGREVARPSGVQDTASQFVQLTWLFTTRPDLLVPGRSVDIPLALPRSVSLWTYDVVARETIYTGFGPVETVHVKPRREPRPGVELTVELWIAPSLQYLPVRCTIHADAQTYADLMLTRLPQQAAPGR